VSNCFERNLKLIGKTNFRENNEECLPFNVVLRLEPDIYVYVVPLNLFKTSSYSPYQNEPLRCTFNEVHIYVLVSLFPPIFCNWSCSYMKRTRKTFSK